MTTETAILLIHCPDTTGIVATVTEFIYKNSGNIVDLDQHVDRANKTFFMRIEWSLENFSIPKDKIGEYFQTLIADKFNMNWMLNFSNETPKMAIFVSKLKHCLYDILTRIDTGEWNVEVPLIISNHPDCEDISKSFGIDYLVFKNVKENKKEIGREQTL